MFTFQMVLKYAVLYTKTFSVCWFIRVVSCMTQMIDISAKFLQIRRGFSPASFLSESYLLILEDLFHGVLLFTCILIQF